MVCRSVGLSVCLNREPCKNGCTDRAAVRDLDTDEPRKHGLERGAHWALPSEYD